MATQNSKKLGIIAVVIVAALAVAGALYMKSQKTDDATSDVTSSESANEEGEGSEHGPEGSGPSGAESEEGAGTNESKNTIVSVKVRNDEKGDAIENLVNASSILDQAKMIDELLDAQFSQMMGDIELDPEEQAQIDKIRDIVSGDKILAAIKEKIYGTMSVEEINDLVQTYQDPTVRELRDRESFLRSPEGQKELMSMTAPPSMTPERRALYEQYDKVSGESARAKEVMKGTAQLLPNDGSGVDFAKQLDSPEFSKMLTEQSIQSHAIKLKDFSDDEVKKLTDIQGKSSMQKQSNAVAETVKDVQGEMFKLVSEAEKNKKDKEPAAAAPVKK
jgi:hypothetical protein